MTEVRGGVAVLATALLLASCAGRTAAARVPDPYCAAGTLDAQGSSAQENAMTRWIEAYQASCPGATVNYEPSGSGAGIKAFVAGTADIAGTESRLKPVEQVQADAQCSGGRAVGLPMVVGPVAVPYRLPGVPELRLTPATLARIFGGTVTRWDDPAIRADNPGVTLPGIPVRPVHRAEASGTTETFTGYLAEVAAREWTFGATREWPVAGGTSAAGSERVAEAVEDGDGTIGYLELSYARERGLSVAALGNAAGRFVAPSGGAAVRSLAGTDPDLRVRVDPAARHPEAYPIVGVTYEIVCDRGVSVDEVALVRGFLGWTASAEGQRAVADLGYAPLPEPLRRRVAEAVARIS